MQLNFTTITWPALAVWGLGLTTLLVGFFIGYIDSNLRSAKKIEAAESKAEMMRTESERKLAEAEALKAKTPTAIDDPGLLRLKNKDGATFLEMDGVALTGKNISADRKKRLIELLSVIRPWLEGGQPISAPALKQTAISPQPTARLASVQATVSSATLPLSLVNLSEKEFKALSIIAQIDHVFQTRIFGTSHEGMGIRIFEGRVGSVEVKIGSNKYASIDDIPDTDVKNAIRAAITEWEEKYTPRQ